MHGKCTAGMFETRVVSFALGSYIFTYCLFAQNDEKKLVSETPRREVPLGTTDVFQNRLEVSFFFYFILTSKTVLKCRVFLLLLSCGVSRNILL